MSRLAATREDLDDDHPAAAAWAGAGQDARLVRRGGLLLLRLNGARRGTDCAGCAADEIGEILLASLESFDALQPRPVKDPASAFSHDQTHFCPRSSASVTMQQVPVRHMRDLVSWPRQHGWMRVQ
jgi:hypothetical protein